MGPRVTTVGSGTIDPKMAADERVQALSLREKRDLKCGPIWGI